jgi:acyl-coenzyme A synthetase/AMP-(fatty) acid ligase/acyl carrier protein
MIEHRNLVNYLLNNKTSYINEQMDGSGSFVHLSYTFDASLTAMFMPLLSGKSVVIGSKHGLEVFEDTNLVKYAPYDLIKLTPSHLELLRSTVPNNNSGGWLTKKLVIGGEALHLSQFNYLVEKGVDVEVINEYGPTEATVGCSTYSFRTLEDNENLKNNVPIGKPIDNTQLYIVNDQNELLPLGVVGELCIGGAGVARGYLNRDELTAEKFIQNPFDNQAGSAIYKTGDLARWKTDGNIEYLGRKDDQVKVNGYRIELGEIESTLQQCDLVSQAVVLAKEDTRGSKRLIGYIVAKTEFNREAITDFLKSKLPDYMVPTMWVAMESLPLTINGKIDRKALPDPEAGELSTKQYVAPRNEIEEKLVAIWQELLEIDKIGIHDDFFDLGGHSLLAIRLVSYIERNLLVSIPLNVLFQFTTISDISKYLEIQASTNDKENKTKFELVEI